MKIKALIKLFRVHQWIKNLIIFSPVFFAGKIFQTHYLFPSVMAFFAFCFAASSVYIINDLIDADRDREHPEKRLRPIASGEVSKNMAWSVAALLLMISLSLIFPLSWQGGCIVLGYALLNLAYSFWLKHFAIIDISIIAVGFVLRILLGGMVTEIPISHWLIFITFLLALSLAVGKRRDDLLIDKNLRPALRGYTVEYVNTLLVVQLTITLVCYIMYTLSPEVSERLHVPNLFITAFPVILGIMRYLQIVFVEQKTGSPTKLFFSDRFLQSCILAWILIFAFLLYEA
jgi:decaprenyl-phosphate phosphoribosyltransferase